MAKKPKNSPCVVAGCKTTAPHNGDPIVATLIHNFSKPERVAHWTLMAIAELGKGMEADLTAGRNFSLLTRNRLPEELYIRALFVMFIASPGQLSHVMSDMMPNSFSDMYREVNKLIFEGRGMLNVTQAGKTFGTFTAMDMINRGAHASFSTMMTVMGLAKHPEYLEPYTSGRYFRHISVYCNRLQSLEQMFKDGKDKATCLQSVIEPRHLSPTAQGEVVVIRYADGTPVQTSNSWGASPLIPIVRSGI
jgi:hypothetical protein